MLTKSSYIGSLTTKLPLIILSFFLVLSAEIQRGPSFPRTTWPTRCWGSGTYLYPSKAGMLRWKSTKLLQKYFQNEWLGLNICSLNVMRGKESNKNEALTYMQQLDSNKNLKFTWEPKNGCRPGSTIFQLPWSKIIAAVLSSVYCILYHNPAVEKTMKPFQSISTVRSFLSWGWNKFTSFFSVYLWILFNSMAINKTYKTGAQNLFCFAGRPRTRGKFQPL